MVPPYETPCFHRVVLTLTASAATVLCMLPRNVYAADWEKVQELKRGFMEKAATHAMEQQKTGQAEPVAIAWPEGTDAGGTLSASGSVKVISRTPEIVVLDMQAAPRVWNQAATETLRIELSEPMDMVAAHSGLALFVETAATTSPEVRIGCRLHDAQGRVADILPAVPVVSKWGENPHEVYLDWSFINYADVGEAVEVLRSVKVLEFTFASSLRTPERGASREAQTASLKLSNLRLVDFLQGSYDPSRRWLKFESDAWQPGGKQDLTLQHRCQEITGIVAAYGDEEGVRSATMSLDHAARTQCWDGSFLDGRRGATTVTSGEYTFGFTIYGLLCGYEALEAAKSPVLAEKITIGPSTMTRREAYQRMFYRAAMARATPPPSEYRDDIIGGDTLSYGANRVLGYAIAMRMVADALTDPALREEVLGKFGPVMDQIAAKQGEYSGGFPILGEGDKYKGEGIHYDAGYTRTHMDWLVVGVHRTGDPRLIDMLKRYQTAFEALMNSSGNGIMEMISERHQGGGDVQLILPDATAQVGMKHQLPIIAQWGHNCGMPVWANFESRPGNHFTFASSVRGYPLGAHVSILMDDMSPTPVPKDLGYLFPRQFPIWSSKLHSKDGELQRTSAVFIREDGSMTNDFEIRVGEFPVTVGVPIQIKSLGGTVKATAVSLSGWPKLLPADAAITLGGDVAAQQGKLGAPFRLKIEKPTRVVVTGPDITLPTEAGGGRVPFRAELLLEPSPDGKELDLTVLGGTTPYEHTTLPTKAP